MFSLAGCPVGDNLPMRPSPDIPKRVPDEDGSAKSPKILGLITDPSKSTLTRYQELIVGSTGLGATIRYELIHGLGAIMPGALGLMFRKMFFPLLLGQAGKGALFGPGVTLRSPKNIRAGKNLIVSDGCILDARNGTAPAIEFGDDVIIGQRAILICKNGTMSFGSRIGIGANCGLYAVGGNRLRLHDDVMLGPCVYLGGVTYRHDRLDIPISEQGHDLRGGVTVGRGTWIGTHATVLDGTTIGEDCIIAAGAVVTKDVPNRRIAGGVPAKILGSRDPGPREESSGP